ncbi:MAG: hypothetical protein RSD97_05285 [Lachnospiraceae bacterium]
MKKLSNLGYLTRLLQISSTELSRYLHVDVSLVSKWKSGSRQLTAKSAYYDEVVAYLLDINFNLGDRILQNFFDSVYPDAVKATIDDVKLCMVRFLNDTYVEIPKSYRNESDALYTAEISIYGDNNGRRKAIDKLLNVASEQDRPGKLITIDCEQFEWLVETDAYAISWSNRLFELLESGFTFEIILHFSLYQENFVRLFLNCSKVLFHKNTTLYYHKYFDEDIYWFSFFCLEHTMSVMGLSMIKGQSHSTVFTDSYSVMQHQGIVEFVKGSCNPMFLECSANALLDKPSFHMTSLVYCNFHSPEILLNKELLLEVLKAAQISEKKKKQCLKFQECILNSSNTSIPTTGKSGIIFFYSHRVIEENRKKAEVECELLSFLMGQTIMMNHEQYESLIVSTKDLIIGHPNMLACFLNEEEDALVPSEYCFCANDKWLFTLNTGHAKLSAQSTLLDTAAVVFEQAWRRVPPTRKV